MLTDEEVAVINKKTTEQSSSSNWKLERAIRITSSKFGEICKITQRRDVLRLVESMLRPRMITTRALRHGIHYEERARAKFMTETGLNVEKCGLIVSKFYPFLAASPDGLVDGDAVLEIKCPFSAKDKDINPDTVQFLDSNGLKREHNYFYQVQGQLMCTSRSKCYFCVFTFKDFKVYTISRDDEFIENTLLPKLSSFYDIYFKPRLVEMNVYKDYCRYFC